MKIYLEEGQVLEEKLQEKIEAAALLLLEREKIDSERVEISLTMVSAEDIRELNRDYRGVDKVTDVLSFPQFEDSSSIPEQGEICLGDVVICVDKVRGQACEYGHSFEREFVYLFVHSLLHLLGYDHMEQEEKSIMRKKEEEVMELLDLRR